MNAPASPRHTFGTCSAHFRQTSSTRRGFSRSSLALLVSRAAPRSLSRHVSLFRCDYHVERSDLTTHRNGDHRAFFSCVLFANPRGFAFFYSLPTGSLFIELVLIFCVPLKYKLLETSANKSNAPPLSARRKVLGKCHGCPDLGSRDCRTRKDFTSDDAVQSQFYDTISKPSASYNAAPKASYNPALGGLPRSKRA